MLATQMYGPPDAPHDNLFLAYALRPSVRAPTAAASLSADVSVGVESAHQLQPGSAGSAGGTMAALAHADATTPTASYTRIAECVQALLFNFIERVPDHSHAVGGTGSDAAGGAAGVAGNQGESSNGGVTPGGGGGGGLLRRLTRSFQQLLALPYRIYSYLFPAPPSDHTLADRSLMLLLLLVYQPMPDASAGADGSLKMR